MKIIVLFLATSFLSAFAQDQFQSTGIRVAFKILEDCVTADIFSSCLKKKAITFIDRLGRMEKFSLTDGIKIIHSTDALSNGTTTEYQMENATQRSSSAKDNILNGMLLDKVSNFIGSRTLEITMPKFSLQDIEQG